MKSNLFKLPYLAIVTSGLLVACNQENVISENEQKPNEILSISVCQTEFSSVDSESRATTDLEGNTSFESNDELGLYVISRSNGMYHYKNVKFTYTEGSGWSTDSDIYYYKNSDYIIYYPYNENMNISTSQTDIEEAIKNVFVNKSDFYNQETAEAYDNVDLMMAKVENPQDNDLQFKLSHEFSMIEISVPVRKYITIKTYGENGAFKYTAPVLLEWNNNGLQYDGENVKPYNVGKGIYRFIAQPGSEISAKIDGYVKYDDVPYNFSTSEPITIEKGKFKSYNIKPNGLEISDDETGRDLEVGDYYYSDGSIYPYGNQEGDNDLNNPMVEGCIGVIYQVADHTYGDNERTAVVGVPEKEWIHGNVIALEDSENSKIAWGSHSTGLEGNIYSGTDENNYIDIDFVTDMRGYELSHNDHFKNEASVKSALEYDKEYPSTSSGWYLPSAGQMMMLWINLGEYNLNMNDDLMIGDNNWEDQKDDCYTKLLSHFTAIGSSLGNVQQWWTVTENYDSGANQNKAWTFKINTQYNNGDKTGFLDRKKDTNQAVVRPVLSF